MANKVLPNYSVGGPLPNPLCYDPRCRTNLQQDIIPSCFPSSPRGDPNQRGWVSKAITTSSEKHLYSPYLFDYGQMFTTYPMGTLYDSDFSQTYPTGLGREKIIGGGHYKVWPLTNAHIFETRDYTNTYFKRPDWHYPDTIDMQPAYVKSDGWSK